MTPDPTFAFVEGPCFNALDFEYVLWINCKFNGLLTSPFDTVEA